MGQICGKKTTELVNEKENKINSNQSTSGYQDTQKEQHKHEHEKEKEHKKEHEYEYTDDSQNEFENENGFKKEHKHEYTDDSQNQSQNENEHIKQSDHQEEEDEDEDDEIDQIVDDEDEDFKNYRSQSIIKQFECNGINVKILVGDFGATNCKLQIGELNLVTRYIKKQEVYTFKNKDYKKFEEIIKDFLKKINIEKKDYPQVAVLAVAGPVYNKKYAITSKNSNWRNVNADLIKKRFGFKETVILNDFTAAGYGLQSLKHNQTIILNDKVRQTGENAFIVGIGTGIGYAQISYINESKKLPSLKDVREYDGDIDNPQMDEDEEEFLRRRKNSLKEYFFTKDEIEKAYVLSSESGNCIFKAFDEEDLEILQFLRKKWQQYNLRIEQVWCGQAMEFLYEYYAIKDELIIQEMDIDDIIDHINDKTDQTCLKVQKFIAKHFYTEIKNIAKRYLVYGGIFIVGRFAKIMSTWVNWNTLDQNEKMQEVLQKIPVYAVTIKNHGLEGCYSWAKKFLFT